MQAADSLEHLKSLLQQVAELMQSPTRAHRREAAAKLTSVAAIASTLAFTLHKAQ